MYKLPPRCENGDPVVSALGDYNVSFPVVRDTVGEVKVSWSSSLLANARQRLAMLCEDVDTVCFLVCYHHTILSCCDTCVSKMREEMSTWT